MNREYNLYIYVYYIYIYIYIMHMYIIYILYIIHNIIHTHTHTHKLHLSFCIHGTYIHDYKLQKYCFQERFPCCICCINTVLINNLIIHIYIYIYNIYIYIYILLSVKFILYICY